MDLSLDPQVSPTGPSDESPAIIVAYVNCVGQTRLPISKQLEIQSSKNVGSMMILSPNVAT